MMTLLKNENSVDHPNQATSRYMVVNKTPKIAENICVISDFAIMREGISSIFQKDLDVKKIELASKNDFLEKFTKNNFNIIITDIEFIDGIDTSFIKQIKLTSPNSKVIVYTSPKNRNKRIRALDNEADFFIYFDDGFKLLEFIVKRMIMKSANMD